MFSHIRKDIAVVVVCNYVEAFAGFLQRSNDAMLVRHRQFADRDLFWLGDPKLVITSTPIPHARYLCDRWGFGGTRVLHPAAPGELLSLDILQDPDLIAEIVRYAGPGRTIQLIPYTNTQEFFYLVQRLETEYGLCVLLPESPAAENLWIRDYMDTKLGFRSLATQWLDQEVKIPLGIVCQTALQVDAAAAWFHRQGKACFIKANDGAGGYGNMLIPAAPAGEADVLQKLRQNNLLRDDIMIVEEFIHSSRQLFPSVELFVPPAGCGQPAVTYVSNQIFSPNGGFAGVLVSRELLDEPWYPALANSGCLIGEHLQEMGYVGNFDLDAIVDDAGQVYLMEVNPRRTGGTHVHEFAQFVLGPNYLDRVTLISHNDIDSHGIVDFNELVTRLEDLLFPIQQEWRGILITLASTLPAGSFGCMAVGASTAEALALQSEINCRLQMVKELEP